MYLSRNLEYLLHQKKMRKADLARLLGVSNQQASKYVDGQNQPRIEALVKMAEHFNVALDDLVLVDLAKGAGRPFGEGMADQVQDADEQTRELNKLLRLRIAELERNLKATDPDLASELGIE
ncbi:helix-turn-helix domain-containing protein [Lewinella sp. W8]|uniref:helix-turn-helix domain-containing protein n=1 Tax=Lewinella sp. W8 TaxID=2528208 RepID=UPI0034CFF889